MFMTSAPSRLCGCGLIEFDWQQWQHKQNVQKLLSSFDSNITKVWFSHGGSQNKEISSEIKKNKLWQKTVVFKVRSWLRRSFHVFIDLARYVHVLICQNLQLLCSHCMDQLTCQDVAAHTEVSTEPPALFPHIDYSNVVYSNKLAASSTMLKKKKRKEESITLCNSPINGK